MLDHPGSCVRTDTGGYGIGVGGECRLLLKNEQLFNDEHRCITSVLYSLVMLEHGCIIIVDWMEFPDSKKEQL